MFSAYSDTHRGMRYHAAIPSLLFCLACHYHISRFQLIIRDHAAPMNISRSHEQVHKCRRHTPRLRHTIAAAAFIFASFRRVSHAAVSRFYSVTYRRPHCHTEKEQGG